MGFREQVSLLCSHPPTLHPLHNPVPSSWCSCIPGACWVTMMMMLTMMVDS